MKKISLFLKAKANLLALMFCGLSVGGWMLVSARGYYWFAFGESRDLGYNAQLLWGLLHGSFSPSILNTSFFADHCYFWAFLVAPIYWAWPDPMTLQYLKITAFFAGAYVFFLILKKYLHPLVAFAAMIAFSVAPANISMLLGLFNYETFALPLVLLIFKAMDDKNFKLYIICCILLALVKEQMPLVVMMFGVLSFVTIKEEKMKWALWPFTAGLLFFIFEVFVLTPYIRKDLPVSIDHYWGARYMQYGQTPREILFFLLTHPARVLAQLVLPMNITWYNGLFSVWGCLAFLSPHILLCALPLFLKSILSSNFQEHDILYQGFYSSIFTPFIFLAAWNTLNQIQNKWRLPVHVLALLIMFIHAFVFIPQRLWFLHPAMTNEALAKQRLIDEIPPQASVLTGLRTYAPLANRRQVYPLSVYLEGQYLVSGEKFELPIDIDYLLLSFADELSLNTGPGRYIPKITALNFDNRWRLQESIEDVALYVKNPSRQTADRLIERQFRPFHVDNTVSLDIDNSIRLEDMEFPKVFPQKYRIFPVTMYWQCLKKSFVPYGISINVTSSNGKSYYSKIRTIGSAIYPAYFWRPGEHVKESYFYLLPSMPRGNFDLTISIYNPFSHKWTVPVSEKFNIA